MSQGEFRYKAQEFFPPWCVECPTLVGFIEDGYLLGDDVAREDVRKVLQDFSMTDIETCPGPAELPAEPQNNLGAGLACSKWLVEELTRNQD